MINGRRLARLFKQALAYCLVRECTLAEYLEDMRYCLTQEGEEGKLITKTIEMLQKQEAIPQIPTENENDDAVTMFTFAILAQIANPEAEINPAEEFLAALEEDSERTETGIEINVGTIRDIH